MEYENDPDSFLEELWNSFSPSQSEDLFEDPADGQEDEEPDLKERLEKLEYRLDRALRCIDRGRKDQAQLTRQCRELEQKLEDCRARQESQRRATRYGLTALFILLAAGQARNLANLGWQLLTWLSQLLNVEDTLTAGVLLAGVILWVIALVGRALTRRLTTRRKGGG